MWFVVGIRFSAGLLVVKLGVFFVVDIVGAGVSVDRLNPE